MPLERWFAKPVMAKVLLLAILAIAAYASTRLELGSKAEGSRLAYAVIFEHSGIDSGEIERSITVPMEAELSRVSGIGEIRSTSEFGKSRVVAYAAYGTEASDFYLQIREAADKIYRELPRSVQKAQIVSSGSSQRPVFVVALRSESMGENELRNFAEKELKPGLEKIDGAGEIELGGGELREIHVLVDTARAATASIGIQDIANAIQAQNLLAPVGILKSEYRDTPVSLRGRFDSLLELRELKLPLAKGGTIGLGDIANVDYGYRERESVSRVNGERGISLYVQAGGDANQIALSRALRESVRQWSSLGIESEIITDEGRSLEKAIEGIFSAMLQAMLVVGIALPLFVGELRKLAGLWLSIPLIVFLSIMAISALGIGIDQYSLAGIAVGIGTIIDTGIIVCEQRDTRRVSKIAMSLVSSLLTTLVVLVPLLFMDFVSSGLSRISGSIGILLVTAFVVMLLFLPVLAGMTRAPGKGLAIRPIEEAKRYLSRRFMRSSSRALLNLVAWAVRARLSVMVGLGAVVVLMVFCVTWMGKDFSPVISDDVIYAHAEFEAEASVDEVDSRIASLCQEMRKETGVLIVESIARRGNADIQVSYDASTTTGELVSKKLEDKGKYLSGGFLYLPEGESIDDRPYEIALTGDEDKRLREEAKKAAEVFSKDPRVSSVVLNFKDAPKAIELKVYRERANIAGTSGERVAEALRWALQGPVAVKWFENDREMDLRIMDEKYSLITREGILALPVGVSESGPIGLKALADLVITSEGEKLYRVNRQKAVFFTVHAKSRNIDEAVTVLRENLDSIELPKGYGFQMDRSVAELNGNFSRLWLTFAFSIALIFIILAIISESIANPLLVLSVLPSSFAFPIAAYAIMGESLNVPVLVGLILLAGLVANSSILIVDEAMTLIRKGLCAGMRKAILRATRSRIRPLLVTSVTTAIGSLPLAFAGGSGGAFMNSLSFVILFGVLGALVSTIVVLPAIAGLVDKAGALHKDQHTKV